MKNYSETICNKSKRQLSAKGNDFLQKCIMIALNKKDLNRYSQEAKPIKSKMKDLIHFLLIDEEKTIEEVKEIIKNRVEKNTLTN
jgi:hypothetical protein